jgi:fatty-acid peroxygenase
VPLEEDELEQRREELSAMIDGAGGVGKRHWQARHARSQAEAWIQALVEQVHMRKCLVNEDRALFRISWHHDADGQLLEPHTAAVEVLNLLRPTVAIARYVSFAALALHEHPHWQATLQAGDEWLEPFVQEVRRYYTFFPFVAARVRESFDWQGYHFPEGQRVLLDLYGTNRDPRTWPAPETFRPERFSQEPFNAYSFIPQGGGDHATGHRCPGEWFTIALMKVAMAQLTRAMRYTVPEQDLSIDWSRMPILPRSGLVIARVEPR